jgi:hypothetical protein
MKKLLFLTSLLFVSLVQAQYSASTLAIVNKVKQNDERKQAEETAQKAKESAIKDANSNYPYLASLKKIANEAECLNIANDLALLQTKKLRLLKVKDLPDQKYYIIKYVPEEMTDAQYQTLTGDEKEALFTVRFSYWNEGENADLEIKGIKTYRFNQVTGSYLQLFSIWKKYCKYDANLEETQEKGTNNLTASDKDINIMFYKYHNSWLILNR